MNMHLLPKYEPENPRKAEKQRLVDAKAPKRLEAPKRILRLIPALLTPNR